MESNSRLDRKIRKGKKKDECKARLLWGLCLLFVTLAGVAASFFVRIYEQKVDDAEALDKCLMDLSNKSVLVRRRRQITLSTPRLQPTWVSNGMDDEDWHGNTLCLTDGACWLCNGSDSKVCADTMAIRSREIEAFDEFTRSINRTIGCCDGAHVNKTESKDDTTLEAHKNATPQFTTSTTRSTSKRTSITTTMDYGNTTEIYNGTTIRPNGTDGNSTSGPHKLARRKRVITTDQAGNIGEGIPIIFRAPEDINSTDIMNATITTYNDTSNGSNTSNVETNNETISLFTTGTTPENNNETSIVTVGDYGNVTEIYNSTIKPTTRVNRNNTKSPRRLSRKKRAIIANQVGDLGEGIPVIFGVVEGINPANIITAAIVIHIDTPNKDGTLAIEDTNWAKQVYKIIKEARDGIEDKECLGTYFSVADIKVHCTTPSGGTKTVYLWGKANKEKIVMGYLKWGSVYNEFKTTCARNSHLKLCTRIMDLLEGRDNLYGTWISGLLDNPTPSAYAILETGNTTHRSKRWSLCIIACSGDPEQTEANRHAIKELADNEKLLMGAVKRLQKFYGSISSSLSWTNFLLHAYVYISDFKSTLNQLGRQIDRSYLLQAGFENMVSSGVPDYTLVDKTLSDKSLMTLDADMLAKYKVRPIRHILSGQQGSVVQTASVTTVTVPRTYSDTTSSGNIVQVSPTIPSKAIKKGGVDGIYEQYYIEEGFILYMSPETNTCGELINTGGTLTFMQTTCPSTSLPTKQLYVGSLPKTNGLLLRIYEPKLQIFRRSGFVMWQGQNCKLNGVQVKSSGYYTTTVSEKYSLVCEDGTAIWREETIIQYKFDGEFPLMTNIGFTFTKTQKNGDDVFAHDFDGWKDTDKIKSDLTIKTKNASWIVIGFIASTVGLVIMIWGIMCVNGNCFSCCYALGCAKHKDRKKKMDVSYKKLRSDEEKIFMSFSDEDDEDDFDKSEIQWGEEIEVYGTLPNSTAARKVRVRIRSGKWYLDSKVWRTVSNPEEDKKFFGAMKNMSPDYIVHFKKNPADVTIINLVGKTMMKTSDFIDFFNVS